MEEKDPDLPQVRSLQGGNETALEELIQRHEKALFAFLFHNVGCLEEARDLTLETFVRAYFHINGFVPRAKFRSWLYQIAINLCRDHLRRRSARAERQTETLDASVEGRSLASGSSPAESAEINDELAQVRQAIRGLPDELRAALVLFAVEGFSQIECADLLGTTAKAVEVRVYRARKLLQERLAKLR